MPPVLLARQGTRGVDIAIPFGEGIPPSISNVLTYYGFQTDISIKSYNRLKLIISIQPKVLRQREWRYPRHVSPVSPTGLAASTPRVLFRQQDCSRSEREMKLSIMFGTIDDRIWSRRNEFIFSNKWTNTLDLVLTIWSDVCDISRSKLTHMILASNNDNDNHNAFGRWKKPLQGQALDHSIWFTFTLCVWTFPNRRSCRHVDNACAWQWERVAFDLSRRRCRDEEVVRIKNEHPDDSLC
ncbi:hypothetical protein D0Y65_005958 [Glycine soja]|uniref:Uncharacterized protein n=1 Tax=Glycine soja TaxID=3848 RepID=A0A445L792_GLYSO|nr:hypothetical protein D0Y65_005958 [Glycine soja]